MSRKIDIPYDLLYKMYITDRLSTPQIAAKLGCGRQTISNKLHDYHIPTRSISDSLKGHISHYQRRLPLN
jgi:hypothetical protein